MSKPLNEICFAEFRSDILKGAIDKSAWYFTQTHIAYYADYRPKSPERTARDLAVCLDLGTVRGRLTLYGNTGALVATVKQYSSMDELLIDFAAGRKSEIAEECGVPASAVVWAGENRFIVVKDGQQIRTWED